MKVLKIWATFQTELKYHDHYLADEMKKNGIETTFFSSDKMNKEYLSFLKNKDIKAGEDKYNGLRILRFRSIEFLGKPFITEIKKMYNEIKKGEFDVIHIYGIGNPITWITFFIFFFLKKKPKIIFNDHSNPSLKSLSFVGKIYYNINKLIFLLFKNYVSYVVAPNLATYKLLKEKYSLDESKLKIIPLGYDNTVFNFIPELKNKEKDKFIIGFAGKLMPGKRIELLIDVLGELDSKNIECSVVGLNEPVSDYQKEIISYAKSKKVNISFKPLIKNPEKLAEFYNYIDLAVFPGSISITTVEANGCGTPIVLYDSIEGLEDRVEDDRGVLFETKEEFKTAILNYRDMKKKGKINNLEIEKNTLKYSWEKLMKEYLNLYSN